MANLSLLVIDLRRGSVGVVARQSVGLGCGGDVRTFFCQIFKTVEVGKDSEQMTGVALAAIE